LGFLDGYCSTVQGLPDWFEVDLGFTKLSSIQTDLCVLCVFVFLSAVGLQRAASSGGQISCEKSSGFDGQTCIK